jgi:hypothetical protein
MMQAGSDIILGWTKGVDTERFYYWRQLRHTKGSAVIERLDPVTLAPARGRQYGWTLPRAHARSGDPVALAVCLGTRDRCDGAMSDFAEEYVDQNERDYEAFTDAIRSGRLAATEGV